MIEVYKNLFVGNQDDYEFKVKREEGWVIVHACKDPYHRRLLGYTGRGAPKSHPEYLFAERGTRLFLNLIDVDSPIYIRKEIIDKALDFIDNALSSGRKCLVHCNQGESRSPSISLLFLAMQGVLSNDFIKAEEEFRAIYPNYSPRNGIREFIRSNWDEYVSN